MNNLQNRFSLTGRLHLPEDKSIDDFQDSLWKWLLKEGWRFDFNEGAAQFMSSSVFHLNYPQANGNYRYYLRRTWDPNKLTVTAILMNPSVATEIDDDPTVNFLVNYFKVNYKCVGSLVVVNTGAYIKSYRTTEKDFIDDKNNWPFIQAAINESRLVILGWGENGRKFGLPKLPQDELRSSLENNIKKLRVFGLSKNKLFPCHPHPPGGSYTNKSRLSKITESEVQRLLKPYIGRSTLRSIT